MEANQEDEQMLDSEVADFIRLLQKILQFLDSNGSRACKLKALWTRAAISSLQGYLNVDNPPKHWEGIKEDVTIIIEGIE